MRRTQGGRAAQWMIVAGVLMAAVPSSSAEPVGSPAGLLKKGQWLFGLSTDGVLGRGAKGSGNPSIGLYQVGHYRGYGVTDWLSLFGKVGWAYLRVTDGQAERGANTFGSNLLISGGVKARLWRNAKRDWEWDASTQYVWIGAPHRRGRNQAQWQEWQFATTTAKTFGRLTPYAGMKVSLVQLDYHLRRGGKDVQKSSYKPDGFLGPVLGADYAVREDTVVNVESSYINGAEVTVGVARTF